jgi:glycosyltransferase involved in cell wall biosynthesis
VTDDLRVGVPAHLLELGADGGHGRIWSRVLMELSARTAVTALGGRHDRRRHRCDVVLCSGHEALPWTGSVPMVAQIHEAGWFTPELRRVLDPGFLAAIGPATERAARVADQVIMPSRAAAADLIAGYGIAAERVHVVHHGVDPVFAPGTAGGAALVAGAGGRADVPYVLYAASLHPRKGLHVLREAMAQLAAAGHPHQLAIAGGPAPDRPDSAELERAAAAELTGATGRVVRVGRPADHQLAALMAGAAAFCLPSLYEGFGLTALEAMACGAPVVVSDRGALPEVVGDAGLTVSPTVDGVRDGLARILSDPSLARRLAVAGPIRAQSFTWQATASGWLKVLERAARQRAT